METLKSVINGLTREPDRTVLIELTDESVQYWSARELVQGAERLSMRLDQAEVGSGDSVVILADPGPQWIQACLAVINIGAVIVPVDTQHDDETLDHILSDCQVRFVFTEQSKLAQLHRLKGEAEISTYLLDERDDGTDQSPIANAPSVSAVPSPEETAVIFYTSGTTGPPKGVPLSHENVTFQIRAVRQTGLLKETDRMLLPLPLHHVYPFVIGILTPLALGVPVVFPHAITGPEILRALREAMVTVILGVPRLYRIIYAGIQGRFDAYGHIAAGLFRGALALSKGLRRRTGVYAGKWLLRPLHQQMGPNLRIVASGGAALDAGLAEDLEGLGWQVAVGYGLTETTAILTLHSPGDTRLNSVGRPLPGLEIRIDPKGLPTDVEKEPANPSGPETVTGEVLAKGPSVFGGYRNLPEADRESFTQDGWFRTGDLGFRDDAGYLYLRGRASTIIVTESGENIQPQQIEAAYTRHPFVAEAGILEQDGHLVGIMVPEVREIKKAGLHVEPAVRRAVMEASKELPTVQRLSDFVVLRQPLPRTRLGKIRRHLLAGLYHDSRSADTATGPPPKPTAAEEMAPEDRSLVQTEPASTVWAFLTRRFSDQPLTLDTSPQLDLGIDSLGWLDLTLEISERAGITLDENAINRIHTLRDLLQECLTAAGRGTDQPAGSLLDTPEAHLSPSQKRWLEPLQGIRLREAYLCHRLNRFLIRRLFGLQVTGAHRLPSDPFVLAPNHLSYLDAPVVAAALDFSAMRRTFWGGWTGAAFGNPVTRHISRLAQVFPVEPESGFFSSLAFGAAVLKHGNNLIWFPEGGRSFSGRLQDFKPGVGRLLHHFRVPVVPAIIRGSYEAMPRGSFLQSFHSIRVSFGRPLDPSRLESVGEGKAPYQRIIHGLRSHMQDMLDESPQRE